MTCSLRCLFLTLAIYLAAVNQGFAFKPMQDPAAYSEKVMKTISSGAINEAADLVAEAAGQSGARDTLAKAMSVIEGKTFEALTKVIDRDFNGALRQIVYYSYVPSLGFVYFRFNYKMTASGWALANFFFKDETNSLFPKDFVEP